jgi:hypothetical protein
VQLARPVTSLKKLRSLDIGPVEQFRGLQNVKGQRLLQPDVYSGSTGVSA